MKFCPFSDGECPSRKVYPLHHILVDAIGDTTEKVEEEKEETNICKLWDEKKKQCVFEKINENLEKIYLCR